MAGALIFTKEAPDILWGVGRCLDRIAALPEKLGTGGPPAVRGGSAVPS